MPLDRGAVMLVGSIARPEDGWDREDVLRECASALGEHVTKLPDGEIGDRYFWINFLARHTYCQHPDMVTLTRHTFEDWKPTGYDDHWKFTLRGGVDSLTFNTLGYADEAKRSYAAFAKLRAQGVVRPGARFMVALPLIESGTRPFIDTAANFEILWDAYADAIVRELEAIAHAIPAEDLAVQWDVCLEMAAAEGVPVNFPSEDLTRLPVDAFERTAEAIARTSRAIPDAAWLGLHLCYGSLGHKEGESADSGMFKPAEDLAKCVEMANQGVAAAGRSVEFVHMPVTYGRGFDEAFYAPLDDLDIGDVRVYLGLIHLHDGVEGASKRIELARRHLPDFGIATQCGWGRRPPNERIEDLLALHRQLAAA